MNTIENRLMELEAKVAFQDETIEILNDELKAHQQQLAKMKRQTELLAEKNQRSTTAFIDVADARAASATLLM